ncbi:Vi polysaccharide biosynthesis UDP-N-acetylglucosamine C-6 dehydrogenase TviB [Pedobacter sp. ASV12]|uniref:Vi polysaccharide biosynthesis UDP-N-acetylglucosamine C-6 dehydrogenase TviB n=1 Tax=Pedobacter sp. ASV12 TaxID=2795120 RepID=UPI0018ECAA8C|nr:Vi polysaccharide biosynthesis UDP-N-acetylglucosamine C-6 dehydrogenase TviB [Pedobacter sp. ASV12]
MHRPINPIRMAVIGLGYVGLPLAVEFAKSHKVIGFDIFGQRIAELNAGKDTTLEVDKEELDKVLTFDCTTLKGLYCTTEIEKLNACTVYIITVPTPVDKNNRPDLSPLIKASALVASVLKKGDMVVYESTVYPGVTEDECVPVLAKKSGLVYNRDFFVGYSPERINPGDKLHTVANILKITSGSTPAAATQVDDLYASVIKAGTYKASSIKVAEAAKVIENAQRDINIAFVNELAMIFNQLGIDTSEVLAAAGTKWNFLNFKPGLVGGHCIGVDPYYLAQKAQEAGYHPEIILAGRRVNDGMGKYVADQLIKQMISKNIAIVGAKVLVLGFTFKENCPDVRNTKVIDIVRRLQEYQLKVTVHDPWANADHAQKHYGIWCENGTSKTRKYDAVVLAVAHQQFKEIDIRALRKTKSVLYDIKSMLPASMEAVRL